MKKIILSRSIVEQALEYMKSVGQMDMYPEEWAIVSRMEAALAQPAIEPVGWRYRYPDGIWRFSNGEQIDGRYPVESQPVYLAHQTIIEPEIKDDNYLVTIDNGDDGASGKTLLDALDDARVFNVSKEETGRFRFEESCDRYYFAELTREQLLALADELRALAG